MTRKIGLIAFAGLAVGQSVASAQTLSTFVLNDGAFRYAEGSITATTLRTGTGAGTANFGFASGTGSGVSSDYLFQNWWWYRGANDTREYALQNQTLGIQLSANSAFLRYEEPSVNGGARDLRFEFTYTLNQISATQAAVTINWSVTNIGTAPVSGINFFSYSDSDIGTSTSDDNGVYTAGGGANFFQNFNSVTDTANFFSVGADLRLNSAYEQGNGFGTTRLGLANTTVTNLANAPASFTGDWAGALQWSNLSLEAGATIGGRVTKGYNYVVPTPGAAALLGLGGLMAARRRRA